MSTFLYLFGVLLGECILKHTDMWLILPVKLLRGSKMMNPMIYSGKKLFNYLQRDLDVDNPVLPRTRKTPRRHEIGSGEGDLIVHPKNT